jgi:hypothetical protein
LCGAIIGWISVILQHAPLGQHFLLHNCRSTHVTDAYIGVMYTTYRKYG